MPTATPASLTEDQVDDLLYLARAGETSELKANINDYSKTLSNPTHAIIAAAVDPNTGNGILHMASANGHTEIMQLILTLSSPNHHSQSNHPTPTINLSPQNTSGNTPLHWAALNGHLPAVKTLVEAGADVTVLNAAGHDATYGAEVSGKGEVAEYLLKVGVGLERGVGGGRKEEQDGDREVEDMDRVDEGGGSDGKGGGGGEAVGEDG